MSPRRENQAYIARIHTLPGEVESIVAGLSAEQLTLAYLPGEWTIAQIVHHLVDSHINSYVRCKLMATEDHPTFKPYDEKAWADLPDSAGPDVSYSLALLRSLHTRWAIFWETLPDDAWARTGYHPEGGEIVTLAEQLRLYAKHGETHLDQIRRVLAAGKS